MSQASAPLPLLPTGILTFLFTDVESSTRMWELYPEQMREDMARHDELIEGCVRQHGGVIVRPRGEGDSRFAVFTRATDAVAAANDIQIHFSKELWNCPTPLRVRIALHTGEAELRDGDYYGSTVNRTARLRSLAHGGQTLITHITNDLVRDTIPDGANLRDLGEHKLKDLKLPEHIFQVIPTDLAEDFPVLAAQGSPPTTLPSILTSFIGRKKEIAEVKRLLVEKRLLTIVGPGGAGKTRLAVRVAADLLDVYPDGVWMVDLTPLSNGELVVHHIMKNLGVREEVAYSPLQTLTDSLRERNMLLVLDNCEHLLQEVAELIESLLIGAPALKILTTSRESIGIPGETLWHIPPLSTPKLNEEIVVENLGKYESVRLFLERAASVKNDFKLTIKNAPAIASITAHLDGIPLAIELAAARIRVLSPEEIADRLDDRFRLLVGNRTAITRQKTLRNLIDWSYDLLSDSERTLLRRLSVFAGGWTLDAAEDICTDAILDKVGILDLLTNLVDKSLVVAETQEEGIRYRFLETIRQYGHDRLVESAEVEEFTRRHAAYFAAFVERSFLELWGTRQEYRLHRLEIENDNLRAAQDWMARDPDSKEPLLKTAMFLWHFWEIRGDIREGRARLEFAMNHYPESPPDLRAEGLRGAGLLALQGGDFAQSIEMHQESLALFRKLDDNLGVARELDALGEIAQYRGEYGQSVELFTEALAIFYKIDNKEGIAESIGHLGVIARDRADYTHARELLQESLKLSRELDDKLMIAEALNNLGLVEHPLCNYERASLLFGEAVSIYRELHDRMGISNTLQNLGDVAKDQGNFQEAIRLYQECITLKKELGDKRGIARATVTLAEVLFHQGNYPQALEKAESSLSLFQELEIKRGINHALQILAYIAIYQGDYERANSLALRCLVLSKEVNSPRAIAYAKELLGLCAFSEGNLDEAGNRFLETLDIFRKFEDRRNVALAEINLARAAYYQGNHEHAHHLLEESLRLSRELKTSWVESFVLEIQGLIERSEGRFEPAFDLFLMSLQFSIQHENQQGIANCLGALAGLAAMSGEPIHAVHLYAGAENIRQAVGGKIGVNDLEEYNRYLARLRDQLPGGIFDATWTEGRSMDPDQFLVILADLRARLFPQKV
jgi:predicted ATPase/class 3 adenylate cyclase